MKKKLFVIIAIAVVIILLVAIFFIATNNGIKIDEVKSEPEVYFVNENGDKVNNSSEIGSKKTVDKYIIENSQIVRSGNISTLTAKVTNGGDDTENVRFKVTFYDKDNNALTTTTVLAGDMKKNSSAYINAGITADVSEAVNIVYEIK